MGQETGKTNSHEAKKRGPDATVMVAIITVIGTIMVALFNFPPFLRLFDPNPSPTPSPTLDTSTASLASAISPTLTEIILPVETSTPEIISSNTVTLSPTPSIAAEMFVSIVASRTTGRAPLTVRFDAKGSYVKAPDGKIFECSKGACRYIWSILLNGQEVARPDVTGGTMDFRFEETGTYLTSVYICHGSKSPTCGNGFIFVIVN
jgi:hypothetical protein